MFSQGYRSLVPAQIRKGMNINTDLDPRWDKLREKAIRGHRAAAIRLKCLDCCCNQVAEVALCELTSCALHPYRTGTFKTGKPAGSGTFTKGGGRKTVARQGRDERIDTSQEAG